MYQFPTGASFAPNAVLIVARNAAQFRARFGFDPAFELTTTGALTDTLTVPNLAKYTAWGSGSLALSNSGDEMLLLGPGDQRVDSVAWENGDFAAAGLAGDASASASESLQRYGDQDTNQMTFDFLHGAPNPGARVVPPPFPAPVPGRALPNGMFAYWGDLHSHSTASDGSGPPRMAFATARAAGLHFFGLTDHDAWLTTEEWDEMGNAARAATVDNAFVALRGFEYTNSEGHVNVFDSDTWVSRDDPAYDTLDKFFAWLAAQTNSVAQLNHPDWKYGGDFDNLAYRASAADKIALIEVGNNAGNKYATFEALFITSLKKQWSVAPTNNSDHHGLNWGSDSPHRVGIIAPALTRANVLDALRARRVFATEDANLAIALQANGAWMGSTIRAAPRLDFTITVSDPDPEPLQLFLFDNGMIVRAQSFTSSNITWTIPVAGNSRHHYFVRVLQADGNTAYTAPIWTDDTPVPTPVVPTETPRAKKNELGPVTIVEAHAAQVDSSVELAGCVTVPPRLFSDRYLYIQDDTGGIRVYLPTKLGDFPDIKLHDQVALRGYAQGSTAEHYIELTEPRAIAGRGVCPPVQPARLSAGEVTNQVEGALVEVRGTIKEVGSSQFVVSDSSGAALVYIDYTTTIRLPRLTRGRSARVIGVVSRANRQPAIFPRFASDLDFAGTPVATRSPATATPRMTTTRGASPTPRVSPTRRLTATRTPTQHVFMRPTLASNESAITIDGYAAAIAGGSITAVASIAFFAFGLMLVMRRVRK